MSSFSPQLLRAKAHELVGAWTHLYGNDSEGVWDEHLPVFNKVIHECAHTQQLDQLLEIVFDETLEQYAEQVSDDEDFEIHHAFHHFLFTHLTTMMKVFSENDTEALLQTEIGAIPLFGHHSVLSQVIEDNTFRQLLHDSGLVPEDANVLMLGLAPISLAQMWMLEAQNLFDATDVLGPLLHHPELIEDNTDVIEQVRHNWRLDFAPPSAQPNAVSSFVAVFAYGVVRTEEDTVIELADSEEPDLEEWAELKDEWVEKQTPESRIGEQQIGIPAPLRDAVAAAMADFALQNMFLQNAVGGNDEALVKIDVVAPWTESEDEEPMVAVGDQTHIYGFGEDEHFMGTLSFNAIVTALMFQDIAHCWETWVGVTPTFYTHDEYARQRPSKVRVLH